MTNPDAPASLLYQLSGDIVVVQTGGEVEMIRSVPPCSAQVMRSSRTMVSRLVAHFHRPCTGRSWVETWGPAERIAADRLLRSCVGHGYLVPVNAGCGQPGQRANCAEPEADALAQSIVVMADRLRGDIRMLGGLGEMCAEAGSAKPASLLLACHCMLKRLTEQVDLMRAGSIRDQLAAVAAEGQAARPDGETRLHLGCGEHHLAGWVNIDIAGGDIRLDLRRGLPYETGSVAAIYLAHVLEHLDYKEEALALLKETKRTLQPGGLLRVVVPNIESFARAYAARDEDFFSRFEALWQRPKSDSLLSCFLHYAGAGGFPAVMDRHRFGYDADTLRALLTQAGFTTPRTCLAGDSEIGDPGLDYSWATVSSASGRPFSLIMEAQAWPHGGT